MVAQRKLRSPIEQNQTRWFVGLIMMDHSVAQVEANAAGGASTALTPSRQLFEEVFMNPPQERTYQMSTPSPMAQISADEAMRLEFAQFRAELSLLRAQMGKREAPDVPPSPRAVAPTVLELQE